MEEEAVRREVLYEFTAQKDLSLFLLCGKVGVVEMLFSYFSKNFLSLVLVRAMHICDEMIMLSFERAWRSCTDLALSLERTEA